MSALATGGLLEERATRRAASASPAFAAPAARTLDLLVLGAILAWAAGFAGLRLLLSPSIGVDDAEMVLLADGLRLGYHPTRPPLHDWLFWLVGQAGGRTLATLVALKYLLLAGAATHFYAAARRLIVSPLGAAAAPAALLFFYHLGYGLNVGYGNTAVLLYVMAATLHLLLAMVGSRRSGHYLLLGLLTGLGLLAKQSFGLFLPALLLAARLTPPLAPVVQDRRIWLSLALGLAIAAPWALWVIDQRGSLLVGGEVGDAAESLGSALLQRLESLLLVGKATAVFCFTFLLAAVPLLLLGLPPARLRAALAAPPVRLIGLQIGFALATLALFALASGSTWLKDRHLHAVAVFLPILVVALAERAGRPLHPRSWRTPALFAAALAATLGAGGGVWWLLREPPPECGRCRFQKPLAELAQQVEAWGLDRGTLLSADQYAAAQIAARLPTLRIRAWAYPDFLPGPRPTGERQRCLLLWPEAIPDGDRQAFLAWAEGIRGAPLPADFDAQPLYFASPANQEMIYGWELVVLPPAGDCR